MNTRKAEQPKTTTQMDNNDNDDDDDEDEGLPQHILDFLVAVMDRARDDDADKTATPVVSLLSGMKINNLKSAQQRVWILSDINDTTPTTIPSNKHSSQTPTKWKLALQSGNNRIVVRQWKASSCWWNLNRNQQQQQQSHKQSQAQSSPTESPNCGGGGGGGGGDDVKIMARSEIAGYRIARQALSSSRSIHIPAVLHFSLDDGDGDNNSATSNKRKQLEHQQHPWALLAYIGPDSTLLNNDDKNNIGCKPDHNWMDGMVKTRFEFGFHEPHPRWGRVPEEYCVDYALVVLRELIMPMHRYLDYYYYENHHREEGKGNDDNDDDHHPLHLEETLLRKPTADNCNNNHHESSGGFTYASMVGMYQIEQEKMEECLVGSSSSSNDNKLMKAANELLKKAIIKLKEQRPYSDQPLKPFVLCHMDCQPQNLLFARRQSSNNDGGRADDGGDDDKARIFSVFDWEEAALADRRFELLLLCRKVCSNRDQAELIWKTYGEEFFSHHRHHNSHNSLGSLEPWLALETVHSITSLLLQSMDLLGGGRSPWESKPDLWGKIKREIRRLVVEYSWSFANIPEFQ